MRLGTVLVGLVLLLIGLGTALFLIGIPFIIVGLVLTFRGLNDQGQPIVLPTPRQPPSPPPTIIQKETVIQREVVKVRCQYCGALNDLATARFCASCGAPIK